MYTIQTRITLLCSTFCLLTSLLTPVAVGGLFRWTDENGKVHYSDSVPPELSQRGHAELDANGNQIDKVAPAKSKEQVEEEKWLTELEKKLKVKQQQQQRDDNLLLNSYPSVEQFDELHAERLKTLDDEYAQLKLLRGKLQEEYERLNGQLKASKNAGTKKRVQQFIDTNQQNTTAYDEAIKQNRKEEQALQEQAAVQRERLVYLLEKKAAEQR
ncbi:MAG: hypothetical protein CSA79_04435 [Thiothrix nivea]|nr:MAG: hypothetical protein CSA79_04435 [Thiothrix nivea]